MPLMCSHNYENMKSWAWAWAYSKFQDWIVELKVVHPRGSGEPEGSATAMLSQPKFWSTRDDMHLIPDAFIRTSSNGIQLHYSIPPIHLAAATAELFLLQLDTDRLDPTILCHSSQIRPTSAVQVQTAQRSARTTMGKNAPKDGSAISPAVKGGCKDIRVQQRPEETRPVLQQFPRERRRPRPYGRSQMARSHT